MDGEVFEILKGLASWASGIAILLIGFAWKQNEEAHKRLQEKTEEAMQAAMKARQDASDSHSILMDRIVNHVDSSVKKAIDYVKEEDGKLHDEAQVMRGHVTTLFANAEKDRQLFREALAAQTERSENRHVEVLNAIHAQSNAMYKALATKADK